MYICSTYAHSTPIPYTPTPTHAHTQDIGVQGYSTLHCIRFRGLDVKMAMPLKKVAEKLGAIDPSARTGQLLKVTNYHCKLNMTSYIGQHMLCST